MSQDAEWNALYAYWAGKAVLFLLIATVVLGLLAKNDILEWSLAFKSALLTATAILVRYFITR
ncbi:TPA: hypothetical protein ACSTNG_001709 [Serratia fonticola]